MSLTCDDCKYHRGQWCHQAPVIVGRDPDAIPCAEFSSKYTMRAPDIPSRKTDEWGRSVTA